MAIQSITGDATGKFITRLANTTCVPEAITGIVTALPLMRSVSMAASAILAVVMLA